MSDRDVLIRRLYEPAVYHRLVEDLAALQRAARHLRAIGWFLFATFTVMLLVAAFLIAGWGPLGIIPALGWAMFSYAVVFMYFVLARHVANGRRPALLVSMLLAGFWALADIVLFLTVSV